VSNEAILIAGPTTSGKSALALALARRRGAAIVNADSMQVYRDLRIITARPSPDEEASAPHRLFGTIDGAENFSVGRWLEAASTILREADRPLVFVGGTGLYFKALTQGLSRIPAVPPQIRERLRRAAERHTPQELHALLTARDPLTAARLRPTDPQRVLRALEVLEATGRPLAHFQDSREGAVLAAGTWRGIFLDVPRDELKRRIEARFHAMMETGALDEVAALAARGLDPALPIMRAHGVPGLIAHLRGEISRDEAIERGIRDTRQYARRQFTFARHQLTDFVWTTPAEAERLMQGD
jgi:tRNA dimethylallyltransferase